MCEREFKTPESRSAHEGWHARWINCPDYEPWNKGLKKESDLRMAKVARSNIKSYQGEVGKLLRQTRSEDTKRFYANGGYNFFKENNPNKTQEWKDMIRPVAKKTMQMMAQPGFISKPQRHLYEEVKKFYYPYNVELEYKLMVNNKQKFLIDVAVPEFNIAFEYDNPNWHNEEIDKRKDEGLKQLGWTTIRITGDYNEQKKCFVRAVI